MSIDQALARLQGAGLPYRSADELVAYQNLSVARIALSPHSPREVGTTLPTVPVQVVRGIALDPAPLTYPRTQRSVPKKHPAKSRAGNVGSPGPLRHQYDLPPVGHPPTGDLRHLTYEMVLNIHFQLVDDFAKTGDPIDPPGTRDGGELLHSAVSRPSTSLAGRLKYPTIEMAAAALLHALVHDHPFHNGNKRTAIVSMLSFLDLNGYVVTAAEEKLFQFVIDLSGHVLPAPQPTTNDESDDETLACAKWIFEHSRKLRVTENVMKWRDLVGILSGYGCTFEPREGNKVLIRRDTYFAHVARRNDGDDLEKSNVSYIRDELHLSEADGVDSSSFYYRAERVPEFINRYRKILTKLASY